jgi:hypothetical protein
VLQTPDPDATRHCSRSAGEHHHGEGGVTAAASTAALASTAAAGNVAPRRDLTERLQAARALEPGRSGDAREQACALLVLFLFCFVFFPRLS